MPMPGSSDAQPPGAGDAPAAAAQPECAAPSWQAARFAQALAQHQAGRLEEARYGYRELLAHAPGHAAATHFLGVALHQGGQHAEGLQLVRASLAAEPAVSEWHNTLGNMLAALGRQDEAVDAFLRALDLAPRSAIAWNNLGALLLAQDNVEAAVTALQNAVAIDPAFRDALSHLGDALSRTGDTHAAALSYCAEYVLRPAAETQRHALGLAFSQLGRYEEAAGVYAAWLADEPGHPIAQHLLQACRGQSCEQGASQAYLQAYFDGFADSFERKLVGQLDYRVPAALAPTLQALGAQPRSVRVLDAGCGTGLCGVALRPFARRLTGVDLSAKALAQAADKGLYDALHQDEIVHYFANCTAASFDLVVAADTLIYFGDLRAFLAGARDALAPGGWLVASFEEWQAPGPVHGGAPGYLLNATGRYSHRANHVQASLAPAGFALVRSDRMALRKELGQPVPGLLVVAQALAR